MDQGTPRQAPLGQSARMSLEAPRAAGIAGLAFAALFAGTLFSLVDLPVLDLRDAEVAAWFADGQDTALLVGALYLAPFASIAFLWFVAVVRSEIGEREDRFFGTVFFGSGLLFVGLVLVAAGVMGSAVVGVRFLGQPPPTSATLDQVHAVSYTLLVVMASRTAALFMLATASIGLRFAVFPRWFAVVGYVIGIALLVGVSVWDEALYLVPAWVAFVSLFILRRTRDAAVAPADGQGRRP